MSENTSNIDATLKSDAFDASDLSLLQKNRLLQDTVAKQKLDFADSIIETRKAQKQLETALSQCSQKDIQINNLTKDNNALQKKINSAADRIEELEKELEKYKQDHAKLQNSIIESRNETVNYRNSYLETQKKLEETQNSEHAAVINLKNSEDTVSKLKDQNDKLRGRITLGEFKEKELSDTIGKLQSENARLKKQIDSLLTGITKNITYTQEIPEAEDSTVLKPEKFVAYIPFCFPERLSTLVSFKREVRNSMRGALTSSKSQIAFPKVFNSPKSISKRISSHNPAFRSQMLFNKINSFDNSKALEKTTKIVKRHCFQLNFALTEQRTRLAFASKIKRDSYAPLKVSLKCRIDKPLPLKIKMIEPPKLNPKAFSYDLFVNYLATMIISDCAWHLIKQREKLLMKPVEERKENFIIKDIYFNETLAFRHRKSIQFSSRLKLNSEIKFEFIKESKLKNVLVSFGKTLDNIVKQFATNTVAVNSKLEEI